jgi:hypothetical protein
MSLLSEKKPPRWRKIPKSELYRAEAYMRPREKFCVAACSRLLRLDETGGHVWQLPGADGEIAALLLHSRRSLFPVFGKKSDVPSPRFLSRFLGKVHIHAVQGLRQDVELLENLMQVQGYCAAEQIDYDLMSFNNAPGASFTPTALRSGLAGLTLRPPLPADEESLFALQAAYEQEEVLPEQSVFNPAAARIGFQQLLAHQRILVAELNGVVVGKINTSAKSFSRYQIGGVYVRPDCRSMGIGSRMTAVFAQSLLAEQQGLTGITLFVKKRNAAAGRVYRKIGFAALADYRITYY